MRSSSLTQDSTSCIKLPLVYLCYLKVALVNESLWLSFSRSVLGGHVTDGNTQFLQSVTSIWIFGLGVNLKSSLLRGNPPPEQQMMKFMQILVHFLKKLYIAPLYSESLNVSSKYNIMEDISVKILTWGCLRIYQICILKFPCVEVAK